MSARFETALAYTLSNEGLTFVDDPVDRGGPTRFGITQVTLSNYVGRAASPQDVANLDKATASAIYQALYWQPLELDEVNVTVGTVIFDMAVLCGVGQGLRLAQRALGAPADGVLGPITRKALAAARPETFILRLVPCVVDHFLRIIHYDPPQIKFLEGWVRRAMKMLSLVQAAPPPLPMPHTTLATK